MKVRSKKDYQIIFRGEKYLLPANTKVELPKNLTDKILQNPRLKRFIKLEEV